MSHVLFWIECCAQTQRRKRPSSFAALPRTARSAAGGSDPRLGSCFSRFSTEGPAGLTQLTCADSGNPTHVLVRGPDISGIFRNLRSRPLPCPARKIHKILADFKTEAEETLSWAFSSGLQTSRLITFDFAAALPFARGFGSGSGGVPPLAEGAAPSVSRDMARLATEPFLSLAKMFGRPVCNT